MKLGDKMNITDFIKDSFNYPSQDWSKVLILGACCIVIGILMIIIDFAIMFTLFNAQSGILGFIILFIVNLIFLALLNIILGGYGLGIIRETIADVAAPIPEFEFGNVLSDGLKVLVLGIIYGIVPIIIWFVLSFAFGAAVSIATLDPNVIIGSFFGTSLITGIIAIFFSLLAIIAFGRLAETGDVGSIIEFGEIFETISKIGWGDYLVWLIVLWLVSIVIMFIVGLINIIPFIGQILYFLIVPGFMLMFVSRAIGLIYNESKV